MAAMAQPDTVACSKCGAVNSRYAQQCRECNWPLFAKAHSQKKPPTAPRPQATVPPGAKAEHIHVTLPLERTAQEAPDRASAFTCPLCGNENVQKVSGVINQGIHHGSSIGSSVGLGHVWGGGNFSTGGLHHSERTSSSRLAQLLSPPAQPARPIPNLAALWAIFWCLAILLAIPALIGLMIGNATLAITLALGYGILWYFKTQGAPGASQALALSMTDWQRKMQTWNLLMYCTRCDHVYNAATGRTAPADQMRNLL